MNLLPYNQKVFLKNDFYRRLAVVSLGLLLVVIILADILLTLLVFKLRLESAQLINIQASQVPADKYQAFTAARQEIILASRHLRQLATLAAPGESATDQLALALKLRPARVQFTELAYSTSTGAAGTIVITGVAASRNDLLKLVAAYQAEPIFARVDSPVENLVKDKDAPFTITLTLK